MRVAPLWSQPALMLCPLHPTVGPPLLTLVNFEVENLVYMVLCLQWAVSGHRVHVLAELPILLWHHCPCGRPQAVIGDLFSPGRVARGLAP